MPNIHSKWGPSSSARWKECSASVHDVTEEDLEVQRENQDTTAADRGTLGHRIVELIHAGKRKEALALREDPLFDEELEDDIQFVLDWVAATFSDSFGDFELEEERRIESGLIDGFGGTIDLVAYNRKNPLIWAVDYKFGREDVQVNDNTQLLCYLLLIFERCADYAERFRATILQGGEEKTVEYTRADLDAVFQWVLRSVTEKFYKAGEHCQYCPLRYRCSTAAEYVFNELEKGDDVKQAGTQRPTPELIDDVVRVAKAAKLGKDMHELAGKVLKKWNSEGIHLGTEAKVTTSNRRKWNDHAEEVLKADLGDQAFNQTLKTPNQIAGLVEDFDVYEALIDVTPTKVLRLGKLPPEFD